MRAMVLDQPRHHAATAGFPIRRPAFKPGAGPGRRLRRLPHRPARGRRRAAEPKAAHHPRPRDRRSIEALGAGVTDFRIGQRVGHPMARPHLRTLPLLSHGRTRTCAMPGLHRLQDGRRLRGVDRRRCRILLPLARDLRRCDAAPLLCAGLIGCRTLRMAGDARRLGIYGFGAAAHIVAQVARHEGRRAVSPSPGRATRRPRISRARLGCVWAGGSTSAAARARRRDDLRAGRQPGPGSR